MLYILTLTFNGKQKLETLYPTLMNSLDGIEYKWFIRDNGSSDNSIEFKNIWNNDNVIFKEIKHNRDGFATGCNYLFKEAKPNDDDLILLLNNDIIFNDKYSIKNMIDLINKDKDIGVVGAKLNFTNTTLLQHVGVVIDKRRNNMPHHFRVGEKEDDESRKNREFNAVTGAVLLTRANLYKSVFHNKPNDSYGMNEGYFFCFEDVDLCYHIKYNMNKKIVLCGQTNIFHDESFTLKKNNYNKLFLQRNVNILIDKWKKYLVDDHDKYLENPRYNIYK